MKGRGPCASSDVQATITLFILKEEMWASLVAQCKDSTCQRRGHWLDPWSGKISHALEQISPRATYDLAHTLQLMRPAHLEPVLRHKRSHRSGQPCTATREKALPQPEKRARSNEDPAQPHVIRRHYFKIYTNEATMAKG